MAKSFFGKLWYFIWEDDSIWSWIVNVILAFLIIKFLIYPGLGFVLGTPAPIVAVVSGSMEHTGDFDEWWNGAACCNDACTEKTIQSRYYSEFNITRDRFRDFDFVNGFNKGDIMILYSADNIEVGDILVYNVDQRADPIIHRVIRIEEKNGERAFWTKGDHNCGIAPFEKGIPESQVVGKAVWRVPFLGWVKILFVDFINLFR